jgi:hypothetical protein
MWFLALIPEVLDALAAGGTALLGWLGASGWWQLPVFVGLWKVAGQASDAATSPPPAPGTPQSPVQRIIDSAGNTAADTVNATDDFVKMLKDNAPLLIIGAIALTVLRR